MNFKRYLIVLCFLVALFASLFAEQVVILGSGPAGLTAAIYTARAGLSPLVVEGEASAMIVSASRIENFPGFPQGIDGYDLQQNMREQAISFGANFESGDVIKVDLSQRPFVLQCESGKTLLAETLILAVGASAIRLGIDSEKKLTGKGVSICTVCDAFIYKGKEVVVVGSGSLALEEALALANYASKVTVIPQGNFLNAPKTLQDKVVANPRIQFLWNYIVEEICDVNSDRVTGVILRDIQSNETKNFPCSGLFVALGFRANTDLLKGQIELNKDGYIITKPFTMNTSVPGVFAAGNVIETPYRQAITAAGSGCMAGVDAYQFLNKNNSKEENP